MGNATRDFEDLHVELFPQYERATLRGTWQMLIDAGVVDATHRRPGPRASLTFERGRLCYELRRRPRTRNERYIDGDWWCCDIGPIEHRYENWVATELRTLERRWQIHELRRRHGVFEKICAARDDAVVQALLRRARGRTTAPKDGAAA